MQFNEEYGILWEFNPLMQIMLGRFEGYMSMSNILRWSVPYNKDKHKVLFRYRQSDWNRCLKHIDKINESKKSKY